MPRPRKTPAATPTPDISGWTKPRQFRLGDETLDDLDAIASYLHAQHGKPHTRSDAIRYAARQIRRGLPAGER